MNYEKESSVICLGDTKQAALYFNRVIIVDPAEHYGFYGLPPFGKDPNNLVFSDETTKEDLTNYLLLFEEFRHAAELPAMSFTRIEDSDYFISNTRKDLIEGYINDEILPNGNTIRNALNHFANRLGINRYSVLLPPHQAFSTQTTDDDLTLTLANIRLIDTAKAEWEQILELRRDKDACKKLRDMKLFLHKNYKGKDKDFIEDDLNKMLDDYYDVCKDHGFETRMSLLSVILGAKNLQASAAGGVAAALLGGPVTGLSAVVFLELGQIALKVAKGRHAFNKIKRDHKLAYIIDVKERIEK